MQCKPKLYVYTQIKLHFEGIGPISAQGRQRARLFLQSSELVGIGTPPPCHPKADVPPLLVPGERHAGGRGGGLGAGWDPNLDEGTDTVVL